MNIVYGPQERTEKDKLWDGCIEYLKAFFLCAPFGIMFGWMLAKCFG